MTSLAHTLPGPLTDEQQFDARWRQWQARGAASDRWWRRTMQTLALIAAAGIGITALVLLY